MKKILFIIDSIGCGGSEKSLLALLNLLNPTELDVTLLVFHKGDSFEYLVPRWIKIKECPKLTGIIKILKNIKYKIRNERVTPGHPAENYWQFIGKFFSPLNVKYDIGIAYHQGFPTYYLSEKVAATKKIAWINVDINSAGYSPNFNNPFYEKMDQTVCVSDQLKHDLTTKGYPLLKKSKVIYDIINPKLIISLSKEFQIKKPNNKLIITTVGRLTKQKNYLLAIETARLLLKIEIDFIWYFVGRGSEQQVIEEKIKEYNLQDNIILTGMQKNPYPWIAACDIYVQTSSFEGFGLTIAEAKILHKPIVTTNFTVVTNQITNGLNGIITEMTPEDLTNGILSIIKNPNFHDSLIKATYRESNETMISESKKIRKLLELD